MSMRYRPEVDGLRGIAVALVLLFHLGVPVSGGFVGVDIFFVISGYLITKAIVSQLQEGQFRLLGFWERRIRRIAPAMTVLVAATLTAGWMLFLPVDLRGLGESALAQSLLAANVYFWKDTNYFTAPPDTKPLLHFWSLAVEEQFYVFLPVALMLVTRFSAKLVRPALALAALLSFAASAAVTHNHPEAAFYLLPTRAWELLIGSLIFAPLAAIGKSRRRRECLSVIGVIAIVASVLFFDSKTVFPGYAALLPCGGAALFIAANEGPLTTMGRLFAWRPLVFLGLISYSLYLWHWPVIVFLKYNALGKLTPLAALAAGVVSIAIAILSWRFIETPFRKKAVAAKRTVLFGGYACSIACTALVGAGLMLSGGAPGRLSAEGMDYAKTAEESTSIRFKPPDPESNGRYRLIGNDGPVQWMLWGDSHANMMVPVIEDLCDENHMRCVVASYASTAPLVGYQSKSLASLKERSIAFSESVVKSVRVRRIPNVIVAAKWFGYFREMTAQSGKDEATQEFERRLKKTISELKDTGAKIWIVQQVPTFSYHVPRALVQAVMRGRRAGEIGMSHRDEQEGVAIVHKLIEQAQEPGVIIVDPRVVLRDEGGFYFAAQGGHALYADTNHLSHYGASLLLPMFRGILGGSSMSVERKTSP